MPSSPGQTADALRDSRAQLPNWIGLGRDMGTDSIGYSSVSCGQRFTYRTRVVYHSSMSSFTFTVGH